MINIQKAQITLELAHLEGRLSKDEIQKARTTKYYRREGSPGSYKYYYTKEEYNKEKGKSSEKEDSKKELPAGTRISEAMYAGDIIKDIAHDLAKHGWRVDEKIEEDVKFNKHESRIHVRGDQNSFPIQSFIKEKYGLNTKILSGKRAGNFTVSFNKNEYFDLNLDSGKALEIAKKHAGQSK